MEIVKTKAFQIIFLTSLVFFITRLVNLTIIPVFADEAIYIHWAQRAWHNAAERFISLSDGKPPLHTWLMIPFLKVIADPLIAGRLLSVLSGLFTFLGTYFLTKRLFGNKTAGLVVLFALLSPFLLFYDRLAVADSLLAAFYIWSVYLASLLWQKRDLGTFFLLVFVLAGGLLVKQPGMYSFVLLAPVFLLHYYESPANKKHSIKTGVWFLISAITAYVLFLLIIKLAPNSHLLSSRTYDYILGKREWLSDPFQLFGGNMRAILTWIGSYQTYSWLFVLSGLVFLPKKLWPKALVIAIAVLMPVLGSAFIGRIIFPRYFLLVQPYLNILYAVFFYEIWKKMAKWKYLLLLIFIQVIYFDLLLLFSPVKAPLNTREQNQYLTTWSSGYGIKEIAVFLKEKYPRDNIMVYTEGYFGTLPDGLLIYLDQYPHIRVQGIGQPIYELPAKVIVGAGEKNTFLVVNSSRISLPDEQKNKVELIREYKKPDFDFLSESLLFFAVK